jgi:hypothetical protein
VKIPVRSPASSMMARRSANTFMLVSSSCRTSPLGGLSNQLIARGLNQRLGWLHIASLVWASRLKFYLGLVR